MPRYPAIINNHDRVQQEDSLELWLCLLPPVSTFTHARRDLELLIHRKNAEAVDKQDESRFPVGFIILDIYYSFALVLFFPNRHPGITGADL